MSPPGADVGHICEQSFSKTEDFQVWRSSADMPAHWVHRLYVGHFTPRETSVNVKLTLSSVPRVVKSLAPDPGISYILPASAYGIFTYELTDNKNLRSLTVLDKDD